MYISEYTLQPLYHYFEPDSEDDDREDIAKILHKAISSKKNINKKFKGVKKKMRMNRNVILQDNEEEGNDVTVDVGNCINVFTDGKSISNLTLASSYLREDSEDYEIRQLQHHVIDVLPEVVDKLNKSDKSIKISMANTMNVYGLKKQDVKDVLENSAFCDSDNVNISFDELDDIPDYRDDITFIATNDKEEK